jgi:hypothetical protein
VPGLDGLPNPAVAIGAVQSTSPSRCRFGAMVSLIARHGPQPSWSLYRGRARGRERVRPNVRAILKHTTTPGIGGLSEWSHVGSIRLPVRDDRHPRMKRAGGYVAGWAAARERSPGGADGGSDQDLDGVRCASERCVDGRAGSGVGRAKRPDSALQAGLGRTLSESVPRLPLPSVTRQELSELREGHVLRDETPTATGMAFLRSVTNDAAAPGYVST